MANPTSVNAFRYESVGVLPSQSAVAGLSGAEVKRAFFRTTAGSEFCGSGNPEDQLENLFDIHCIGQRNSKYMRAWHKRKAPQWDRSMCTHTRMYSAKPLGDFIVNRQLASVNKEAQVNGGPKSTPTSFSSRTKYSDDFRPPTPAEARGARPDAAIAIEGKSPLLGTGELMEVESHEHTQFGEPPIALARVSRVKPPKTTLGVPEISVPAVRTAYRDEFNRSNSASAIGRHREKLRPGPVAAALAADENTALRAASRKQRALSAGGTRGARGSTDKRRPPALHNVRPASAPIRRRG